MYRSIMVITVSIILDSGIKESLTRNMSLRVLLADESDTIKKVFQLALQDLNAEVKSVHSGLDVMDVAKTFKPDIVFADILLQKKNGYEICLQIKQSPELKNIPVVLMWSSFMELDQEQYRKSLASDQLEKPFDADLLREIVKRHTSISAPADDPMAAFLSFPANLSEDSMSSDRIPLNIDLSMPQNTAEPIALEESDDEENTSEFNLSALTEEPQTESDSLTRPALNLATPDMKSLFDDLAAEAAPATNQESWKEKDLSQFKIGEDKSDDLDKFEALNLGNTNTNTNTQTAPVAATNVSSPDKKAGFALELTADSSSSIVTGASDEIDRFSLSKTILPPKEPGSITNTNTATKPAIKTSSMTGMNDSEIEAIVRAHTEEVIKNQMRDSLVHIIERIVREELNRIMEEEIRLQQDADLDT